MNEPKRWRSWWLIVVAVVLVPVLALVIWPQGVFEPRADRLVRQLLTAKEAKDRGNAARELGKMGPAARSAAPALVEALGDKGRYLTPTLLIIPQENYVASDAYVALKSIGGPETVEALANALAEMPARKLAWERGEIQDRGPIMEMERMLAELLADQGAAGLPAAERLLDAMDGNGNGGMTNPGVKAIVAMQIPVDSPAADKARKVLPNLCNSSDGTGRIAATELRRLSPNDDKAYEIYVRSMLSGNLPPPPGALVLDEKTVPLVISNLSMWTHEGAIKQLSEAEPAVVLGSLREALKSNDFRIRSGAALAIARRGVDFAAAEPELMPLLADKNETVRFAAATAFWLCVHKVDVALPVLLAERYNDKSDAREQARKFLAGRGAADAWAAPALVALAGSGQEKRLRLEAIGILTQIGPAAAGQLPGLLTLLRDDDADIQRAAAKAVAAVEKK